MKYLVFIVLALNLLNCSPTQKRDDNQDVINLDNEMGKKLIENGFLDYSDSLKVDSLKFEIIESFKIHNEANNKLVHIDAEELAEFNFNFFLPHLNRILLKRGLELDIETANGYETSNDIFINGQRIKLYTKAELESGAFWDSAPRNFFNKVNDILKEENIHERFYLLYGGNDLHTFLLTDHQFKIIAERYKDDKNEVPYLP